MYDALAPGGAIVVEESDVGLLNMSGTPDAPRATTILEQVVSNWAAAGIMNTLLGRRIPALVRDVGVEAFGADTMTGLGSIGDPAYDAMRLAWPDVRHAAATVGTPEADLAHIDRAFEVHGNPDGCHDPLQRLGPQAGPTQPRPQYRSIAAGIADLIRTQRSRTQAGGEHRSAVMIPVAWLSRSVGNVGGPRSLGLTRRSAGPEVGCLGSDQSAG